MLDINLQLDAFNIPALFQAKPAQIKKAHRRAMGKTLRWLNTRITRELGAQFDLPQRVFQVRAKKQFDADSGSLWIGLNPIALILRFATHSTYCCNSLSFSPIIEPSLKRYSAHLFSSSTVFLNA